MHCSDITCTENFSVKSKRFFNFCITIQQTLKREDYFIYKGAKVFLRKLFLNIIEDFIEHSSNCCNNQIRRHSSIYNYIIIINNDKYIT